MTSLAIDPPAEAVDFAEYPNLQKFVSGWQPPENTVGHLREQALAAVAEASLLSPVIQWAVNFSVSNLQGERGLRPTPLLDHKRLGLIEDEAEEIAEQLEAIWETFASSPDATSAGNMDFASMMESALRRSFSTGEILLSVDYIDDPFRDLGTGFSAIDTNRISRYSLNGSEIPEGHKVLQGIEMNEVTGRISAVYLMKPQKQAGQQQATVYNHQGERHEVENEWRRPKLIFNIMDRLGPGVVRGVSPLLSAVERALQIDQIEGATLDQAREILKVSWHITTGTDPQLAGQYLTEDVGEIYKKRLQALDQFLGKMPLRMPQGTRVNFLPPGTELKTTSPQIQGGQLDIILYRLYAEIARACGMSYAELTGDYSKETFSSSRSGNVGPWQLVFQRRHSFVEPVYQAAYSCVIEEAFARGMIKVPRKAEPFWHARNAWTKCRWTGPARPSADPLKDAQADDIALKNGTTSLTRLGLEKGFDHRELLEQRAREKAYAEKLGLTLYADARPAPMAPPQPEEKEG